MFGAITGVLASRSKIKTPSIVQYYTSTLYGILVEEELEVFLPELLEGAILSPSEDELNPAIPSIIGGSLGVSINFLETLPGTGDKLSVGFPRIISSSLVQTVSFKNFTGGNNELLRMEVPKVLSGTLQTTISFINHTAVSEKLTVSVPQLKSGSLL